MDSIRFSVNGLLLGVMNIVLLLAALSSQGTGESHGGVARGGLSLCALLFSLICGVMGDSAPRNLLLTGLLYAWGRICLLLTQSFELNIVARMALAVMGIAYVVWSWLPPREIRMLSKAIPATRVTE